MQYLSDYLNQQYEFGDTIDMIQKPFEAHVNSLGIT